MKSILQVKKLLGLVEMKSGLVNANFSFPEWQGVKMIFFVPCPCRFYSRKSICLFYEHEAPGKKDQGVAGENFFIIPGLLWTTFVFASFLQASIFF